MRNIWIVLLLSACAGPALNTEGMTAEQKMMVYDRMKLTPSVQPFYPIQTGRERTTTCIQVSPAIVQCN